MIGGYFLSITFIYFFYYYYFLIYKKSLTFDIKTLIIVILISSMSQVGDITVSYFKRQSKVKDTGKIIPGHGGLLDRIDGMILAFPFFNFIFLINK